MTDLNTIREYFSQDRFAAFAGCIIEDAGKDHARCSMRLTDNHRNALGLVMGGAIFTLADFAFAVAANVDSVPTVATSSSISFLSSSKGTMLMADAKPLHSGKNTCTFIINVTDENGKPIASVTTGGFRKG